MTLETFVDKYVAGECFTQAECAFLLGVTRHTVGRIEAKALAKIRDGLEAQGITIESVADFLRPDNYVDPKYMDVDAGCRVRGNPTWRAA